MNSQGGRPRKYEPENGDVIVFSDMEKLKYSGFDKEKTLCDYIERHIENFCRDILEDKYISYQTEVQKKSQEYFMPREPRVDFVIQCEKKQYLIEIKNPKNISENRNALGQILCYSALFEEEKPYQLIIITTKFDHLTAKTIKNFDLPIRYIYFERNMCMEYLGEMNE